MFKPFPPSFHCPQFVMDAPRDGATATIAGDRMPDTATADRAIAIVVVHQRQLEMLGDAPSHDDRLPALDAIEADLPRFNTMLVDLGGDPVEMRHPDHPALRHIMVLFDMAYALKPLSATTS